MEANHECHVKWKKHQTELIVTKERTFLWGGLLLWHGFKEAVGGFLFVCLLLPEGRYVGVKLLGSISRNLFI